MLILRRLPLWGLACLAPVLASCGTSSDGNTIKIAEVSAETGTGVPTPEYLAGAKSAVAAINAAGGIKGRKLQLVSCDTQARAESSAACWRQVTADNGVVAVVGSDFLDQASTDVISHSKLPVIGFYPITPFDVTDSHSFPVDGALRTIPAGEALYAVRHGAKSLGLIRFDLPQAAPIDAAVRNVLQANGGRLTAVQRLSTSTTDFSAPVAALLNAKVDAVLVATGSQNQPIVQALHQQGFKGQTLIMASTAADSHLNNFGVDTKGLIGVSAFAPTLTATTNKMIDRFSADMKKYQPRVGVGDLAARTWLSVNIVADAIKNVKGEVNRQSVQQSLSAFKGYSTGGLTPPLDFSKKGPFTDAPRVVNTYVGYMVSNGRQWTWDGKLVSVTGGPDFSSVGAD